VSKSNANRTRTKEERGSRSVVSKSNANRTQTKEERGSRPVVSEAARIGHERGSRSTKVEHENKPTP